ncbi:MAG: hypothetical protein HYY80_05895 [Chloroflexi bacterium]|nr:hypothetical protein [Chloroflexota bacterium]
MLRDEYFTGDSDKSPIEISSKKPSIEELISLLRQLSKMLELANSQNPRLSNAVGKLANILSRYKDKSIDDVLDSLTIAKRTQSVKRLSKARFSESEAKSLTLEQIERLLESEELGKSDLITIAVLRFGMSKAELMKTRKTYIIEEIKTAITNLRTLDTIGKQAAGNR